MAWGRRKSFPKLTKNQPPPQFFSFFCNNSLSLHSLHRALSDSKPSCHQLVFHPFHHTYSSQLKAPLFSSTAAAAHQHHHFHFLPSPVSAAAAPTPPQMSPPASGWLPGPPLTSLQVGDNNCFSPRKVASRSTRPVATAKLHAERELTVHVLHIIHFTWAELVLVQTSPQKGEKESMLGRYRPTVFWVYAWPSHLGWPGPPVLIIFI